MLWWTYQQLRSSNLKTRLAVIAKLAEFKHADCVEPLLFALKDKDPEIRSSAALALGEFSDKGVVEPLIKLLADPSPLARSTAAEVLGQLKERGIALSNMIEVDQYDTALILIASGCGVSIVPAAARLLAAPGVAYRQLAEPITGPIVLCHRDGDQSPELQTLYRVLSQFLAERGHPVPAALTPISFPLQES